VTRLFHPVQHQPIQACERCGLPWPCPAEQARQETQRLVAERVRIATDAALAMKASGPWPAERDAATDDTPARPVGRQDKEGQR
jgi:hypothetical protein